ncbi:MAG: OmpA family protein [Alphaproteobacteria bacterium]|nr:OmpA family protein [Alphaproteobacteria bacterium]
MRSLLSPVLVPLVLMCTMSAGCVAAKEMRRELDSTERLIEKTRKMFGSACAPVDFATAESQASFARIEFDQGNARRALLHTTAASEAAARAWASTETCGGKDYDGDGIADVVDQCPEQPEDIDGDRDEDGCRDLDPYGDIDRDGIRNIDDDCIEEPEDYDGHNDEDGCPETSEDSDGDGVIDATDKCPNEAEDLDGFKDVDGCPDPDNDMDGIIDLRDNCPTAPEDLDDWDDDDGCPDDDNDGDGVHDLDDNCPNQPGARDNRGCPTSDLDGDGIADLNDACPDKPETRNGYLDDDGCPDEATAATVKVKVDRQRLKLDQAIRFTGTTAELQTGSYALLDEVARVIKDLPDVRVRVEGHTDATGDESADMALSRRRAEVVFDYLVAKGVPSDRLTVEGYGGTRPIDTNRTAAGRENNRRIEFWFLGN